MHPSAPRTRRLFNQALELQEPPEFSAVGGRGQRQLCEQFFLLSPFLILSPFLLQGLLSATAFGCIASLSGRRWWLLLLLPLLLLL